MYCCVLLQYDNAMGDFESQIRNPKIHVFPEGSVQSIDLKPYGWEHYPVVVFAPGWLGTFLKYESALKEIFQTNRRVVSVEYERVGGQAPRLNEYFQVEVQKAGMLFGVLKEMQLKKVHLIAHSEGAINSLIGVRKNPEIVEKIVLLNPAGLIKRDNIFFFLFRFLMPEKRRQIAAQKKIVFQEHRKNAETVEKRSMRQKMERITKQLIGNIFKNPIRFLHEARAISNSSIYENLAFVSGAGIHVGIIIGDNDKVFPEKRIRFDLENEEKKNGGKIVDFLVTLEGEHSDLASDETALSDIDKDTKIEFESAEYISSAISILEKLPGRSV